MSLYKAYDKVDREALWNVLIMNGAGVQLLEFFYREASTCVRMDEVVVSEFYYRSE